MLNDFQKENTELKFKLIEMKMQDSVANIEIFKLKQNYKHLQSRHKEKEVECEDKSITLRMLEACKKERDSYINEVKKKQK